MSAVDTTHECPAPGCVRRVPFERLACPSHWYAISAPTRRRLLKAWRDEPGTDAYFQVRAECLAELGIPLDAIADLNGGVVLRSRQ